MIAEVLVPIGEVFAAAIVATLIILRALNKEEDDNDEH